MLKRSLGVLAVLSLASTAVLPACGSSNPGGFDTNPDASTPHHGDDDVDASYDGGTPPPTLGDGSTPPPTHDGDPTTCADAAQAKSYVGCDYWPTILANPVDEVFDFAVVVANVGTSAADVTVTGPNSTNQKTTVQPGELAKIYLPWVPQLKGKIDTMGGATIKASQLVKGGAYHLVSTTPVIVYQFNALEFKGAGGPPGKDWSKCQTSILSPGCYSYTNDAALLVPSTAMTGTYRVFGEAGWSHHPIDAFTGQVQTNQPLVDSESATVAITGTADGTKVTMNLPANGKVIASSGGEIAASDGGGQVTFTLNAGDVAEVVSGLGNKFDLSGSLVKADKPVQVIAGVPCIYLPLDKQACDHIEEAVPPAETLGKHYVVTVPTSPHAKVVGHIVRFYGNADGTTLTYTPSAPAGCPTTLNAGQVGECTGTVTTDFEVTGDHEFGVGSFMLAGELVDKAAGLNLPEGDPSQSLAVAVEQYRKTYLFLAPDDYTESFVDIVAPAGTSVTLDGSAVPASSFTPVGAFTVARVTLGAGKSGAHSLQADKAVGIQVMGYGANTSYQYPGGLNLGQIAPVPVK